MDNDDKDPHSMFVAQLTTKRDDIRCISIMKLHTKDVVHISCREEGKFGPNMGYLILSSILNRISYLLIMCHINVTVPVRTKHN